MNKQQERGLAVGASLGFSIGGAVSFAWEAAAGHEVWTILGGYALIVSGAILLNRRVRSNEFGARMLAYVVAISGAFALHMAGRLLGPAQQIGGAMEYVLL